MDRNVNVKHQAVTLSETEYMEAGHVGCGGCGAIHGMRFALKAMGPKTVAVISASCWSAICGALKIPFTHCAFATAGAWASGIRAGLDVLGDKETTVLAWAGDGGTFDIGLQSLSAAAERNTNFIYICNDNEAYMNTGIQRSSATPPGAWTTTTPAHGGKNQPKKDIDAIMAAHHIPYVATASLAYPKDMVRKLERAKNTSGTRFLHILSPCPTGWRFSPNQTVRMARLSAQTRVMPLFEVIDGKEYHVQSTEDVKPVEAYLKEQGRFGWLNTDDIRNIQESVDKHWDELKAKSKTVTCI